VELDLSRVELGITRTFDDTWDAFIRMPYFVKEQRASVLLSPGMDPEEKSAALESSYTHHRSETYRGVGDFELGVGWRKRDVLLEGSVIRISAGVALPTGEYESLDPLAAGERGERHLHIQFGNGTVDPLVDCYLGLPLSQHWAFSVYGKGRLPLYENVAGYLGSVEGVLLPRVTFLATKQLSISVGVAMNYFGYAEWNGVRDPNSGQYTMNTALSVGYKFNENLTASLSSLLPLYTKAFSGEDSLEPAPTVNLSLAWTF
jgi:hypothetical protein